MTPKKYIYSTVIIAVLLFIGFYRDFLFKSINALLLAWDNDIEYHLSYGLSFLEEMEYDSLVRLKWFLTLLFAGLYLLLSLITMRILFNNRHFGRLTFFAYIVLLACSGIVTLSGALFPTISDHTYTFARYLMGIAQSPLVLMILIPCFVFTLKQEQLKQKNNE